MDTLSSTSSGGMRRRLAGRRFSPLVMAGVMTIMIIASITGIHCLRDAGERIQHSLAVREEMESLLSRLTDVETGTRGFLLNGDPGYLLPMDMGVGEAGEHLRNLAMLVRDNPAQRQAMVQLERLVPVRIDEARHLVRTARMRGLAVARQEFREGQGKRLHDRIRLLITRMRSHEDAVLLQKRVDEAASQKLGIGVIIVSLALVALAFFLSGRSAAAMVKAEFARRESDSRYRHMVEASPDLTVVSQEGRITYVNKAGERLLKADAAAIVGQSVETLFRTAASEFPARVLPALAEAPATSGIFRETIVAADGSTFEAEVLAVSYHSQGCIRVQLFCRDITERVGLEEQLNQSQRLEALGQLTGGVAHDFNNLLTVIMGNADTLMEVLNERPGNEDLQELARMIFLAADQGSSLTSHLLAFARRQALDPKPVDVDVLIRTLSPMLRRTLGEDMELVTFSEDEVCRCLVDPGQLEAALLNLCLNARDAMTGGGRLTVEARNVELDETYAVWNEGVIPGNYVRVSVSDNGSGMAPEVLDRVFEPFFTTKPPGEGSGLGLSMVYGFLKQSGGHAKVYSEVGQGTTINLYLPCALEGEGGGLPVSRSDSTAIVGGAERILLVEDDDLVCAHVVGQIKALGYQVKSVSDGVQALDLLKSEPFDLLFTDVVMPGGINGRKLADEAQRLQPRIAVLFTSGYTENAIVHHGRLDPGVKLLQKPYRRAELARALRGAMDGRDVDWRVPAGG